MSERQTVEAAVEHGVPTIKIDKTNPQPFSVPGIEILEVLGAGANGVVFEGYDPLLARAVAVKVFHGRPGRSADRYRRQVMAEMRKAATLQHPGIAAVYFGGELPSGWPYMVMQRSPGKSFRQLGPDLMRRSAFDRAGLLSATFRALKYTEERRIAHGDLHFGNVILPDEGPSLVRLEDNKIAIGPSVQLVDCGTSILAGNAYSSRRHARLLREFAFKLLPELAEYCDPLPSLEQQTGFEMLPELDSALSFYNDMNDATEIDRVGIELPARLTRPDDDVMRLGLDISKLAFFNFGRIIRKVREAKGKAFTRQVEWAVAFWVSNGEHLEPGDLEGGLIRILKDAGFTIDDAARLEIQDSIEPAQEGGQ